MKVINAENQVMGRLAAKVAKLALEGETVRVVNSEKAIITGRKEQIFQKYHQRRIRGEPHHGPKFPRKADRLMKRAIRGMIGYKSAKGREAFKKIKTYIGIPEEFKSEKMESFQKANMTKLKTIKYITVGELSKWLGSKW
ncbi:MAG: 50S ribosomal protein L13 [Candidatus Nanoarchaeia archaeon]|nr:50S ribosomal protein L13 [Candidatus Nanoarchaeia archaeon]